MISRLFPMLNSLPMLVLLAGVACSSGAPAASAPTASAPTASPAPAGAAAPAVASPSAVANAAASQQSFTQGQFAGKTLNIAVAPGRVDDLNRDVVADFEKLSGAKVQVTGARSDEQAARLRIEKARPSLDIAWIDLGPALALAKEGLIAKVSLQDVPNIALISQAAQTPLGIAPVTFSSALGFLYNKDLVKNPPKSWADLWDPRFKGQIAAFDTGSTIGYLELVIAAKLNGGSEQNMNPGFQKLSQLKPNIASFKTSGPDNNNLVAQGEAGITFALANQTLDLQKKGAPVDWIVPSDGAATLPQGFQVVQNAPEPELARAFLNYTLSTEVQTRFANDLLLAVTNTQVKLDPALAPLVPLNNLQYFDWDAIGASSGQWTDRFNREILGG